MGNAHSRSAGTDILHASDMAVVRGELQRVDMTFAAACFDRALRATAAAGTDVDDDTHGRHNPAVSGVQLPRSVSEEGTPAATEHQAAAESPTDASEQRSRSSMAVNEFSWARGITRSGTRHASVAMVQQDEEDATADGARVCALDRLISRSQFADIFTHARMVAPIPSSSTGTSSRAASGTPAPPEPARLVTMRLPLSVFDAFAVVRLPRPLPREIPLPAPPVAPSPVAAKSPVRAPPRLFRMPSMRAGRATSDLSQSDESALSSGRGSPRKSPQPPSARSPNVAPQSKPRSRSFSQAEPVIAAMTPSAELHLPEQEVAPDAPAGLAHTSARAAYQSDVHMDIQPSEAPLLVASRAEEDEVGSGSALDLPLADSSLVDAAAASDDACSPAIYVSARRSRSHAGRLQLACSAMATAQIRACSAPHRLETTMSVPAARPAAGAAANVVSEVVAPLVENEGSPIVCSFPLELETDLNLIQPEPTRLATQRACSAPLTRLEAHTQRRRNSWACFSSISSSDARFYLPTPSDTGNAGITPQKGGDSAPTSDGTTSSLVAGDGQPSMSDDTAKKAQPTLSRGRMPSTRNLRTAPHGLLGSSQSRSSHRRGVRFASPRPRTTADRRGMASHLRVQTLEAPVTQHSLPVADSARAETPVRRVTTESTAPADVRQPQGTDVDVVTVGAPVGVASQLAGGEAQQACSPRSAGDAAVVVTASSADEAAPTTSTAAVLPPVQEALPMESSSLVQNESVEMPAALTGRSADEPEPDDQVAEAALEDGLQAREKAVLVKAGAALGQEFSMLRTGSATPRTKLRALARLAAGSALHTARRVSGGAAMAAGASGVRRSVATDTAAKKLAVVPPTRVLTSYEWSTASAVTLYHRLHVVRAMLRAPPAAPADKQRLTRQSRAQLPVEDGAISVARMLALAPDTKLLDEAVRRVSSVASALELFTLLALYAQGTTDDKAMLLYRVFSARSSALRSHLMTFTGLRCLICNVLSVWYAVGELPSAPTNALVEAIVADAVAFATYSLYAPPVTDALHVAAPVSQELVHAGGTVIRRLSLTSPDAPQAASTYVVAPPVSTPNTANEVPLLPFVMWIKHLCVTDHTPRVVNAFVALCHELQRAVDPSGGHAAKPKGRSASVLSVAGHAGEDARPAAPPTHDSVTIPFSARGPGQTARASGQQLYGMTSSDAQGMTVMDPATAQLLQTQVAQLLLAVYLHASYDTVNGFVRAIANVANMRSCAQRARQQVLHARRDARVATKVGPVSVGPPTVAHTRTQEAAQTASGKAAARKGGPSAAAAAAAAAATESFWRLLGPGDASNVAQATGMNLDALWFKMVIAAASPWQVGKQNILPASTQQYIALTPFAASLHHARAVLTSIALGKPLGSELQSSARASGVGLTPAKRLSSSSPTTDSNGRRVSAGASSSAKAGKKATASAVSELFGDLTLRSPRRAGEHSGRGTSAAARGRLTLSPAVMHAPKLKHLADPVRPPVQPAGEDPGATTSAMQPIRRRRRSSMLASSLERIESDFVSVANNLSRACTMMEQAEMIAEGIDTRDPAIVAERREMLRRKFKRTMQRAVALGRAMGTLSDAPMVHHHRKVRELGSVVSSVMVSPRDVLSARKVLSPIARRPVAGVRSSAEPGSLSPSPLPGELARQLPPLTSPSTSRLDTGHLSATSGGRLLPVSSSSSLVSEGELMLPEKRTFSRSPFTKAPWQSAATTQLSPLRARAPLDESVFDAILREPA